MTQQAQAQAEALKPCPFCGGKATGRTILARLHFKQRYVIEGECDCGSGLSGYSQNEVSARWNRRAPAQLEAQQAVQMPEAVYTLRVRGRLHDYTPGLPAFDLPDGEHKLYTEQQVRAMVAAQAAPGWQLVPVEPTKEMLASIMSEGELDALRETAPEHRPLLIYRAGIPERYAAMLSAAAAPTPFAPLAMGSSMMVYDVRESRERYQKGDK